MIYLFNQTEELIDVIDEASLAEFTHTIELNQFDRASFEIPVDYKPNIIKEAQFFGFQSRDRAFCLFRISEKSYDLGLTIQGIDRAESDLHSFIIENKRPSGTADQVLRGILEGTGYQLADTNRLIVNGKMSFYYISVRQALVKIIESYGCEFRVRYTFVENKIIGRYIDLYQRFGHKTGHQFEYGSNILNVTYEESSDEVVTALIGRGKGEQNTDETGEATGGYGRRIQFKDVIWSVSKGDPVDKPAGQNYVANEAARNIYGLHQNGAIKHRFGVYTNEDIESPVELLKATYKELQRLSVPIVTFKANLLDLANAIEQDVWIGDSIGIVRDQIGIAFEARIHKLTIDKLDGNRSVAELGDYQTLQAKDRSSRQQAIIDAVSGFSESLIEEAIANEVERRDKEFDEKMRINKLEFDNALESVKAKAEEDKQKLSNTIDQRFDSFDNGPLQEVKRRAEEALRNAGASTLLAQEAKRISLESTAKLEEFKRQATSAQTALSGDLDTLKRTVASEVNQASEYRRTTTEALSRMTGQMEGFATKSEVAQGIDGLTQTFAKMKVGGRNLIRNYDWNGLLPLNIAGPGWKFERVEDQFAKSGYMLKATCTKAGNGGFHRNLFDLRSDEFQGKNLTWSWEMKTSRSITFYVMGFEAGGLQRNVPVSTEWTRITNTFQVAFKQYYSCVFYANGWQVGDVVYIRDPQLEEGTIATTPRPAPEDGKDEILAARTEFKQTADGLSTKMAAVETYVDQDNQRQESLRRYTREESAKQATAVRELVARDYVGKATHQEDVRGLEHKFETITNPQNGTIATQIANYKQSVDGRFTEITSLLSGKVNQTDFQHVKETSQLYERILGNTDNGVANNVARMALTNQLFQVEVSKAAKGGRNYIRGIKEMRVASGSWDSGTFRGSGSGSVRTIEVSDSPVSGFNKALRIISSDPKGQIGVAQDGFEIMPGTYTMSVWIKGSAGQRVRLQNYWWSDDSTGISPEFILKDDKWTYLTFSSERKKAGKLSIGYVYLVNGAKGSYLDILAPQLEEGSIATSARPALEDTDEAIRSVQSQLTDSWAVQTLTSAGSIVSQINATNNQILIEAEKIRLKGKTLLDESTAIQGYFKRLFVGDASVGTLNSDIIRSNSITADKLVMDMAMARRFVSSDIFTDTLAAKEAFINKLRSVVVTATLLEGYKGRIGGFQIGTHEKDSSVYWITGQNQFSVGMSNGSGHWSQTALWVNWGNNWGSPGNSAWFVKNNGKMYCYNQAEFWNTPIVHGNLEVTGDIFFRLPSGRIGYWTSSGSFKRFEENAGYIYFYRYDNSYSWIPINKDISDRRYKSNIQDSQVSALDVIENLKTYSYRKEYDDKVEDISCGIMAQDVQKYAHEAFFENPDGAYSYNTFALVPYLIKAIQELNQKIEKLEKTA